MKIHIVQKGDTLWNLAQKYGVDFEEMKQMNNHLADPDMLMPGMKVKVPSTAVQAKKELPKKEMPKKLLPLKKEVPKKDMSKLDMLKKDVPKMENLFKKGAPEELPKKEMQKVESIMDTPKKGMPKKEMQKVESIMDTPKKGLPKKELPKIGDILDDLKPMVKELLHEMKPEIINEIKIDLQMVSETNKYAIQEVKPFHHTPPPMPKVQMPSPYMAEEKPKVAPMAHPCPPYPTPSVVQSNVGHCHHGNKMGQGYNAGYGAGPMMHQVPWQPQPYQAPAQSWQQPPYQQAPITPWQNQGLNQHSPAPYPSSMIPGANHGTYGMPTGHHPAHNHPHHQHRTTISSEEDTDDTRLN